MMILDMLEVLVFVPGQLVGLGVFIMPQPGELSHLSHKAGS